MAYLALGLTTALLLVLLHTRWYGLVLGLVATVAILLATTPRWWARVPFCVGFTLLVGYAATRRSEGDFLLSTTTADYVVAYGAAPFVLVFGLATTALATRTPPQESPANLR